MNKTIISFIGAILTFGILATAAMACPWDGYRGGGGWGWGNNNGTYSNNYNNQGAGYQKFIDETSSIREQLASKNGAYNAIMAQKNPDPKQAAKVQAEIATLHEQLRQKGRAYDMPGPESYNNAVPYYHGYCTYDNRGW